MRQNKQPKDDRTAETTPPIPESTAEARKAEARQIMHETFTQREERIGGVQERKRTGAAPPPDAVPAIANSRRLEEGPTQGKTHRPRFLEVGGEQVSGKGRGQHREPIAPPGSAGAPSPEQAELGEEEHPKRRAG